MKFLNVMATRIYIVISRHGDMDQDLCTWFILSRITKAVAVAMALPVRDAAPPHPVPWITRRVATCA